MAAAGLGDLHSLLGMCEIVEIAHSDNLCFQTPSPHRVKWTLLALRCREGHSSQGAPRKMAVPWAGECLPGADDFKKKKKKANQNPTCWRRKAEKQRSPSAVEIALSASVSGWLACWLWQKLMGTMWQSTWERVGGCQVFLRICVCIYECVFIIPSLLQLPVWLVPASCGDVAFPWNEECVKESVVAYTYEHMEALESRHAVCH